MMPAVRVQPRVKCPVTLAAAEGVDDRGRLRRGIRLRGDVYVTNARGERRLAAAWVGAGGRARRLVAARVTDAHEFEVGVVRVRTRPEDGGTLVPGGQRCDRPDAGVDSVLRQTLGDRRRRFLTPAACWRRASVLRLFRQVLVQSPEHLRTNVHRPCYGRRVNLSAVGGPVAEHHEFLNPRENRIRYDTSCLQLTKEMHQWLPIVYPVSTG